MEELIQYLNNSGFTYEIIRHETPIHTAQEGAEYFGITVGQTAPTLIVSTSQGLIALIISGNKKVDFSQLGEKLGIQINGLAKRSEVKKATGFTPGAIPMIGHGLPCVIDTALFEYSEIYGGAGDENYTLKISPQALAALNQVIAQV